MLILRKIKRLLLRSVYGVRLSYFVRHIIIFAYASLFGSKNQTSNKKASEVAQHISEHGFYLCNINELMHSDEASLVRSVSEEKFSELSHIKTSGNENKSIEKNFLKRFSTIADIANLEDPLVASSVNGIFFEIAEHYFNSMVRITNLDYWLNFPVSRNRNPFSSQMWHRDFEDHRVLKVFYYATDVTDESGPFYYVRHSQPGGEWGSLFPSKPPFGVIVEDHQLEVSGAAECIIKFTPKAGTIIIVDTAGLHKGGRCLSAERKLFTVTYTSLAGISRRNYRFSKRVTDRLTARAKTAVFR